jgi:NifU-like protein involved in Fe-S cluster formation/TusA-related sulfurtransferase
MIVEISNMFEYSQKAKDHFKNPRNVGVLEDPDGVGEAGSLACGQMLRLMIRLDAEGKIGAAKFRAFGPASIIAACSAMTEILIGKTIDEAEKITGRTISDFLDGLPDEREFCSDICVEALHLTVKNCRERNVEKPENMDPATTDRVLDCRGLACPLNFVKTKILLDEMSQGETLCVLLSNEGARNVPESAKAEGHEVVVKKQIDDYWKIVLQKNGTNHA